MNYESRLSLIPDTNFFVLAGYVCFFRAFSGMQERDHGASKTV